MIVLFAVVAALAVVAIALVAVGRVSAQLAARPSVSVFDLDEAVEYVADRLSPAAAGQLSYDDVRRLLDWHLAYFESRGVADERDPLGVLLAAAAPAGEGAGDDGDAVPVLTDDDGSLAYVIGSAAEAGLEVDDVLVAEVLAQQMGYLRAIGAIGATATE